MEALTFSVSPDQALRQFEDWADREQGLGLLLNWNGGVHITAAYVPVWSFDLNVRFSRDGSYAWKPSVFSVYQNQPIVYVSGLACYAGHSYRRSLLNPIHNTTLVFLGDETQPFDRWMLRDMRLSNGERLQITPDPWNASRHHCLEIVRSDLEAITQAEEPSAVVQLQMVNAKRVYMPTYVIEYSILGMQYEAFVSGCDEGAGVSGVNHQVWSSQQPSNFIPSPSFVSNASTVAQAGLRVFGTRGILAVASLAIQFVGNLLARFAVRIPAIAVLGGLWVGFRKIVQPWMDQRTATAAWEREREWEQQEATSSYRADDFEDYTQAGRRYFQQNRARILRHMSGESEHQQGDYDWYKEWEEWARQQFERQQQQGYYSQQQQQQQRSSSGSRRRTKPKSEFQWDFDPNDPYSVLGIRPGADMKEVAGAFRREMLKYHPDVQTNASEAEKERATERSKLITEAYRKIKSERKKK